MMRFFSVLVVLASMVTMSEAGPLQRMLGSRRSAPAPQAVCSTCSTPTNPPASTLSGGTGLAQQKAEEHARLGRGGHLGGSLGAGGFEGTGWSAGSADAAVRSCCYWGQRTPIDIGVARGANGYFAVVHYR